MDLHRSTHCRILPFYSIKDIIGLEILLFLPLLRLEDWRKQQFLVSSLRISFLWIA